MSSMDELRNLIVAIVRSSANGIIGLQDLKRVFFEQEGMSLDGAAKSVGGFRDGLELIRKWPSDFTVQCAGFQTTIHAVKTDHISELNKQSKKRAHRQSQSSFWYQQQELGCPSPPLLLSDQKPCAISSEDETNSPQLYKPDVEKREIRPAEKIDNIVSAVSHHDPQAEAVGSPRLEDPRIITTTDKVILPSKPFNQPTLQKFKIHILDVINPHRFWFTEHSEFRRLNELMTKMTAFYKTHSTDLKIEAKHLQKGLHVAAQFSGLWHRSVILKAKANNVRVLYVDFGTVEDVPLERVCYLLEDFIAEPSFMQRGVLGFVQPTDGRWGPVITKYVKKLRGKTAKAMIFHKNLSDSSYILSIKIASDDCLSEFLIFKKYCVPDSDFLTKEKVNNCELDFADYEAGKHIRRKEEIEDWLPKALVKRGQCSTIAGQPRDVLTSVTSLLNTKTSKKDPSQSSPLPSHSAAQKPLTSASIATSSPAMRLSPFVNTFKEPDKAQQVESCIKSIIKAPPQPITKATQPIVKAPQPISKAPQPIDTSIKSPQQISSTTKDVPPIQRCDGKLVIRCVADLSWANFQAGSIKTVYFQAVNSLSDFYVFLKDEFQELRDYFAEFNNACNEELIHSKNFDVGTDIVTVNDGGTSFCRGRILEQMKDNETMKIMLFDFGVVVERSKEKLFYLDEKWTRRQPSAYPGKLAKVPEHIHIKTVADLKERVIEGFVNVKVSAVNNAGATMILINP